MQIAFAFIYAHNVKHYLSGQPEKENTVGKVIKYVLGVCLAVPSASFALAGPPLDVSDALHANAASSPEKAMPKTASEDLFVKTAVSPDHFLGGATVFVKDAKGVLVGKGVTSSKGAVRIGFRHHLRGIQYPLSLTTKGGIYNGKPFNGSLKGRYSYSSKLPVIYLDLISTSASEFANKKISYVQAVEKVRASLGIDKSAPDSILHSRNKYVEHALFIAEVEKTVTHQALVRKVARYARTGQKVETLHKPNWYEQIKGKGISKTIKPNLAGDSNPGRFDKRVLLPRDTSTTPLCSVSLGDGSVTSSTNSGNTIENFGVIGLQLLLKAAGIPSTSNNLITGMLLAPFGVSGGTAVSPELEAIDSVGADLNCIESQVNYLSVELNALELQVTVGEMTSCITAIDNAWVYYGGLTDGTYPTIDLEFTDLFNTAAENAMTTCADIINKTVFFAWPGGGTPAWALYNQNYQTANAYYNQSNVQALQMFISYYSTYAYKQFVLTSEYNNLKGYFAATQLLSGYASTNTAGTILCKSGTTASTQSFCAYQSNFSDAMPGSLYSDELGLYNTGNAITVYPTAATYDFGGGGPAVQGGVNGEKLEAQAYALFQTGSYKANCEQTPSIYSTYMTSCAYPSTTYTGSELIASAINASQSLGLNPLNTAETYEVWYNPQTFHTLVLTSSELSQLLNNPSTYYYLYQNLVFSDSSVPSTIVASDSSVQVNYNLISTYLGGSLTTSGYYTANYKNAFAYKGSYPGAQIGAFLGRVWWAGAPNAASYTPPTPAQ